MSVSNLSSAKKDCCTWDESPLIRESKEGPGERPLVPEVVA